jgi:phosphopantothenate-cysteine ligase
MISFKLETDESLLHKKATDSLKSYGHELVIGNLLQNHKDSVTLFTKQFAATAATGGHNGEMQPEKIARTKDQIDQELDIEDQLVARIVQLHTDFINSH